jgi:hypothetical protein
MSQAFCTPIGSTTARLWLISKGEAGRLGAGVVLVVPAGLTGPETNGVGGRFLFFPPRALGSCSSSSEEMLNDTDFLLCVGRCEGRSGVTVMAGTPGIAGEGSGEVAGVECGERGTARNGEVGTSECGPGPACVSSAV